MTWTKYTEPDGNWNIDDFFGFLLQETGEFLLQQNSYLIELDYARNSSWNKYTEPSTTWIVKTVT